MSNISSVPKKTNEMTIFDYDLNESDQHIAGSKAAIDWY